MDDHERWLAACAEMGFKPEARTYVEGTRTSQDAADQLGCEVAHIAKSILFRTENGPVLVITSGANRVDRKKKVKSIIGCKASMADAEYVFESTSYHIGGVPPFGHPRQLTVLMDEDLLQYETVWGAGGTPQTVFPITPDELLRLSGAVIGDVKQASG